MTIPETMLVKLDHARALLNECRTVEDAKSVGDIAAAAQTYARQAKLGQEAENYAFEIRMRAERRMGEILLVTPRNPGAKGIGPIAVRAIDSNSPPSLPDLGISRNRSSQAQKLAALPVEEFEKVAARETSLTEVKREIKERAREQHREQNRVVVEQTKPVDLWASGAKFSTIVIDPPWDWGDEGDIDQMGRARPTYQTMPISDLAALPIASVADADSHMYLWITNRSLPKGFALLDGWGFRYITCITWVKPSFGMGNYYRGQTEQVLFGVRGSLMLRRRDAATVIHAPRGSGGHSSKPDEFYAMVESCSPGPYLDMFSRRDRPGWRSWGAEV